MSVAERLRIEPSGPFSWSAALDVLAHWSPVQRHLPGSDGIVRLAFPLDRSFTPVAVAVYPSGAGLEVEVEGSDDCEAVAVQVARTFSLDLDGAGYPAVGDRNPPIGRIMAALPGLRPVCFTSPYEAAAWGVISARIGLAQAAAVQDRLIAGYGHVLHVAGAELRAFPSPQRLLDVETVAGLSSEKIERLHSVAGAALEGILDADCLRELGDEAGPASLRVIRGIGEFWSHGVYLRACGIVDVFAMEPLSVAALGHLYALGDQPDGGTLEALTARFRPYRMWVCFLLRVTASRGLIPGVAGREGIIRRQAQRRRPADR